MDYSIEILVKGVGKLDIQTKDSDDFGIPLTFNISDIKDFASRKASFSKTIKILGTKNNNIIFDQLYEIKGQNFAFDMTAKHDCVLIVNKNPVMNGFLVLKKIEKLLIGNKYQVVYNIVMFDETKNFFEEIKGKELQDLDFSSGWTYGDITYGVGDHVYNETTIKETAENTFLDVYCYSMVDYGYYDDEKVFPYNDTITTNLLYPSTYLKPVVDKIFNDAGYSYESDFLDGSSHGGIFKQMVMLHNNSNEYVNLRICEYVTGSFVFPSSNNNGFIPFGRFYNQLIGGISTSYYEVGDFYGVSGSSVGIEIPFDGDYEISLRLDVGDDEGGLYEWPYGLTCAIDTTYHLGVKYSDGGGDTLQTWDSTFFRDYVGDDEAVGWFWEGIADTGNTADLKQGDILYMFVNGGTYGMEYEPPADPCISQQVSVTFDGASIEGVLVRELDETLSGTTDGPLITIDHILPNMNQDDLLRNLIKMFNLYIYTEDDPKKLYIEPRDDFYKKGTLVNWDRKVDYNKNIIIKTLNNDIANEIRFEYSLGEDFYSQKYFNEWYETYGTKVLEQNNPYLKENKSIKLDIQSYTMFNEDDDEIMPRLYEKDNSQHTIFDDRIEFEPMIAFETIVEKSGLGFKVGNLEYDAYGTTYRNAGINKLKFASHAGLFGGWSFDLNYETTGETFSFTGYDNTRGLYKIFWENYMNDLIDDDARIVELYCNFDLADILKLNFKNIIFIDGQNYYLQKLEYDPSKKSSSKVTLLKVMDPIGEGSFDSCFLLKNDSGDYILTDDTDSKIIIC